MLLKLCKIRTYLSNNYPSILWLWGNNLTYFLFGFRSPPHCYTSFFVKFALYSKILDYMLWTIFSLIHSFWFFPRSTFHDQICIYLFVSEEDIYFLKEIFLLTHIHYMGVGGGSQHIIRLQYVHANLM